MSPGFIRSIYTRASLQGMATKGLLFALLTVLGACDLFDTGAKTEAIGSDQLTVADDEGTKPVEPAVESVPAFTPRTDDSAAQWESRMPADGGRTILVPATTLFPGNARVDPQVENPYSGNADAIAAGERHFVAYNCAGCHAPLGGGGMGPPLSDDVWIYGSEPAQIYLSIMHGRGNGMPAWASMLPGKTAWEIVAYIGTLDQIDNYARTAGFDERSPPQNRPSEDDADDDVQGAD